jgi:transcription-repair coupling factor (superfamily II helicase)
MDRLICGDVGYGKTEVAIRAAFRAVSDGKQVVVLVPTTVLAFQHEQNFKARMKDYPINIESVSRFKTSKEQKTILEGVAKGRIDIIIGTHRLLSKDVSFNDLGLVIVDEEHRFGVEHKERLKTLRTNIHVVTLTATPIPRTLHMALSGLRDISLINTPPVDRLPIRTYVSKLDDALIQKAITFELNRGGQVFFLHNRVQSIQEIAKRIKELVPTANIGIGHGQMSEGELEKTMLDFYQKRTNVLVSTTIIESGLDVPSANTIIINRADMLGLAQLYQIRGRVGRGQQRAYAYLLIPAEGAVTEDAKRRLEVIQRFVELGSGFSIASHDLEIRGGGDLLGPQQSGHIAAVGFDLYTELLEEAIHELEGTPQTAQTQTRREPEIKLPFAAFLGEEYVPDIHQRLSLYRRFSATTQEGELDALEEELRDRFGPLPPEAQNLLWMIRLKQLLVKIGIDSLTAGPEKVSMIIGSGSSIDPVKAISVVAGDRSRYQLTPDPSGPGHTKLVAKVPTGSLRDLYFAIESLLKRFTGIAA